MTTSWYSKLLISRYSTLLNITYCHDLKDMPRIHILPTPHQNHQKVLLKVPIITFHQVKSLKDILVRAKVPPLKKLKILVDHVKIEV